MITARNELEAGAARNIEAPREGAHSGNVSGQGHLMDFDLGKEWRRTAKQPVVSPTGIANLRKARGGRGC